MAGSTNAEDDSYSPYDCCALSETEHRHWGLSITNNENAAVGNHFQFPPKRMGFNSGCKATAGDNDNRPRSCHPMEFSELPDNASFVLSGFQQDDARPGVRTKRSELKRSFSCGAAERKDNLNLKTKKVANGHSSPQPYSEQSYPDQRTRSNSDRSDMTRTIRYPDIFQESLPRNHNAEDAKRPSERGVVLLGKTGEGKQAKNFDSNSIQPPVNIQRRCHGSREYLGFCRLCHSQIYTPCHHFSSVDPTEDSSRVISERTAENGHVCVAGSKHAQMHQHYANSDTCEKPGKSKGITTPRPSFQKAEAKSSRAESSNTRKEIVRGGGATQPGRITNNGHDDASKTKQQRQKEDNSQSKRTNGRVQKTGHEYEEGSERRQTNTRPEIQKAGYSSRTNPAAKSLKAARQHELPNNIHAISQLEPRSRSRNGTADRIKGAAARVSGRTATEDRRDKRVRNPWQVYHVTSEKPPGQAELTAAMVREVKELYPSLHSSLHVVPPVHFNMTKATEMPGMKGVYLAGDTPDSSSRTDEARERIIDILREVLKDRRAFVLPGVTFEDYLNKRIPAPGSLQSAAAPHQSQRTVPIPYFPKSADLSTQYRRGEVEVLIVDKARGLLIMDVKVVGDTFGDMQVGVSQAVELVRKVLEKALTLMAKSRDVVLHLVSDIRATVPVNLLLALPNLRKDLLERTLEAHPKLGKALQRCLNTRAPLADVCLCAEDLPGKHQASTDRDVLHLAEWWDRHYPDNGPPIIEDDVYETIIGRFCGPFSTVSVWTPPHQAPRSEVRTPGQAVRETGDRCAALVLLPQQREVLQRSLPKVYLTGPPGSGKTLILILKGVRWVRETAGGVVTVLSPKAEPSAVSLVIQKQILHTLKQLGHDVTENDVTTDTIVTNYDGLRPGGSSLVRRLKRVMKSRSKGDQERPLCLLLDEIQGEVIPYVADLCQRLPGVCFWGSGAWPSSCPPGFVCQELSTPVRCPPAVQRLLEMTEPSTDGWHTKKEGTGSSSSAAAAAAGRQYRYITRSTEVPHHPLPSSGLPVKLLSHAAHHGYPTAGRGGGGRDDVPILECHQCAEELVHYLRFLRVGRDIGPGEVLILTADRAPLEHGFHSSKFVQCLLRSGLQLDLIHDYAGSQKKLAFPSNKITVTSFQFVVGLERKVVVFLPEGTVRDNVDPDDSMDSISTLSVENLSGYESDDEESDAEDMCEVFGTLWDEIGTGSETSSRAEDQAGKQDHDKDAISVSQSSESPAFLPSSSNLNNVNLNCCWESGCDDDAYFSTQDTSGKDSCGELVKERLQSVTSTQARLTVSHANHEEPGDDDSYSSRRETSEEQDEAEKRLENGQHIKTLLTPLHAKYREDDEARFSKEERGDIPSALHRLRKDRLQRTGSSSIAQTVSCHTSAKQPTDSISDSLSGPKSELPSNPNMSETLSRSRTTLPSFPKPEMMLSSSTAEMRSKTETPSNPNSENNSSPKTEPPASRKLQTHLSSPKAKILSDPNSETSGEQRVNWPSEAPTTRDKETDTGTEAGRRSSWGVVQGCCESSRLRAAVDSMSASNRDSLWFSVSRALAHAVVFHFSDSLG